MTEAKVVVKSQVGLHARPAAMFVQEAIKHKCSIKVESAGKKADGKSILQVLSLGVKCGQEITLYADGPGEEEAIASLVKLVSETTA
ncbi:MAG TPA: HPr family phosphocarrier protein [Firmicutes bacterium]|nr:HPr family phosphocarrier protein [Candidatus Fermentithermobacillaceae bacterium]